MIEFKITFPSGYNIDNVNNDNIDVNIILKDEQVFFATFFTIENIKQLMDKNELDYFWADSMIITKKLDKESMRRAIILAFEDETFNSIFSKIGNITDVFGVDKHFNEIIDFSNGFDIR